MYLGIFLTSKKVGIGKLLQEQKQEVDNNRLRNFSADRAGKKENKEIGKGVLWVRLLIMELSIHKPVISGKCRLCWQ